MAAVLLASFTEIGIWGVWLRLAGVVGGAFGLGFAGCLLAVLLVPQHTVEDAVFRDRYPPADLVDRRTIGYSLVVAGGATAWLVFARRGDAVEPLLDAFGLGPVPPVLAGVAFARRP